MDITRQAINFEIETLMMRPEQEVLLMDMIHGVSITRVYDLSLRKKNYVVGLNMFNGVLLVFAQAAYKDNTLGLPKICPKDNIPKIDQQLLFTYMKHHFSPKRMVIAGVGVDHNRLVENVQK